MSIVVGHKPDKTAQTPYHASHFYNRSAVQADQERYIFLAEDQEDDRNKKNMGKYSVFEIANWFLKKEEMTQKKVQKLCYYAQAWCYALKDYRLEDTDYQAWIQGPVSQDLWEKFKSFGYDPIGINETCALHIADEDIGLLEDVWDTYGENTGNALEILSQRELPWMEARKGYEPDEICTVVISPDTMASYYRSLYCGAL
jgi:uncharacterized phage-associated protein